MQDKKRILLVDDDEVHLYTTKELLQNDHFEIITHKTWFGVTNHVKTLQPDLVLLDVNMPGLSDDNLGSVLRIYEDVGQNPIVFHSSNDEDSLRESVTTHGVRGYICKGDVATLRKKVNEYLHKPVID